MVSDTGAVSGPDLGQGIPFSDLPDGGMLTGHFGGEAVMLVRRGEAVYAIGAICTHYGASLADGIVAGDTVRCPWHHACFSLRNGEALRAPALNPVSCWRVARRDGAVYVQGKLDRPAPPRLALSGLPSSVVIVGGGAAGNAAAETLRKEGFSGGITLLSADDSGPYDRPNLSKSYLAGAAEEDWIPLRSPDYYSGHRIDLMLNTPVAAVDVASRKLRLANGTGLAFDALLLATGAEPVRLDIPGANLAHVHYLRTLADSRALIAKAESARRAVVLGASFIGLEVAASLRARNIEVDVAAPEAIPMERILGPEAGNFIRRLHEGHGVGFHLGTTARSISAQSVTLNNGKILEADFVVIGAGVRPLVTLAEQAGLSIDRGVMVNEYLETSAHGIFAAGDIARWPDRLTGESIRIEHFVVAERQGQTAARNILGARERFDAIPFFWTEQYDVAIAYVGHAERWDTAEIDGSLDARDCMISYHRGGKKLAVATIGRDRASLQAEAAFEHAIISG
ncbi:MAG: FAD-dependent oxidoreductase [Beijerinckiaceae bacterium]|nr:FAD-dependent oxidoreductase [Beijerinckiaceae bacterium]MCI0734757.1 FAD-dependent oxidoreductase [Beijerinckiaceae bacterium]